MIHFKLSIDNENYTPFPFGLGEAGFEARGSSVFTCKDDYCEKGALSGIPGPQPEEDGENHEYIICT